MIAAVLVEFRPRIRLFNGKPFACIICMAGWIGLFIGLYEGYKWESGGVMLCSMFFAMLWAGIKMRWL